MVGGLLVLTLVLGSSGTVFAASTSQKTTVKGVNTDVDNDNDNDVSKVAGKDPDNDAARLSKKTNSVKTGQTKIVKTTIKKAKKVKTVKLPKVTTTTPLQ